MDEKRASPDTTHEGTSAPRFHWKRGLAVAAIAWVVIGRAIDIPSIAYLDVPTRVVVAIVGLILPIALGYLAGRGHGMGIDRWIGRSWAVDDPVGPPPRTWALFTIITYVSTVAFQYTVLSSPSPSIRQEIALLSAFVIIPTVVCYVTGRLLGIHGRRDWQRAWLWVMVGVLLLNPYVVRACAALGGVQA